MMECSDSEIKRMYDTVFDGVKAPEKLYKKVMDISHTKKRSMNGMKKTAIVFAVAIAVILGSNGIVSAATGTGWIGRLIVRWSEDEREVTFSERTNSKGETYYVGTVQNEKGDAITVTTKDLDILRGKSFRIDGTEIYVIFEDGTEKRIEVYDQEEGYTVGGVFVTPLPENR